MTMIDNKATLRRAAERWNAGDLDGYLQLYDPNALVHGIPVDQPGLAGIRGFYEGFWAAFPGSQLSFEDVVVEGDRVAVRFVVRGTHRGAFMGVPPTGKEVAVPGITILRFAGGKCVERWNQADFLGLMQQLGVLPAQR
jgi:steroid delta-isomerase-like uncharacterized protein